MKLVALRWLLDPATSFLALRFVLKNAAICPTTRPGGWPG